jgi:hypothetical protein
MEKVDKSAYSIDSCHLLFCDGDLIPEDIAEELHNCLRIPQYLLEYRSKLRILHNKLLHYGLNVLRIFADLLAKLSNNGVVAELFNVYTGVSATTSARCLLLL